jgi:MFS family permease
MVGATHNPKRLLWAGFFAIFASGVGFSVRGGILIEWARAYGFTMSELGGITGGGLTGFGIIILIGALIADRVGYGKLMVFAFVMHVLSAILQLATGQVFAQFGQAATYWNLFVAMFLFSIGNGMCEAVVNPMVAALFPKEKTHYLNILHAGWPGGLIAGGLISYVMNGGSIGSWVPFPNKVDWVIQMSLFLVPVFFYGAMLIGQEFPRSEASQAGLSFGTMLAEFASPLLILLLLLHAMLGYVELGTDSWISKITGAIMAKPTWGLLLFVYTSSLMFILRFCAGPLERLLSPLGILCIGSLFGCIGLTLLGTATTVAMCVIAATVYALGKTFLWPTILAVASECFPRGGAIVIGAMGGAGMLSAGLLGGPGIGFQQDFFATEDLKEKAPQAYVRYQAEHENTFLGTFRVKGLDGTKVGVLDLATEPADSEAAKKERDTQLRLTVERAKRASWWANAEPYAPQDRPPITEAELFGGQMALKLTALVPATMAVLFLCLIMYFRMRGGYKAIHIDPSGKMHEEAVT